MTTKTHLPGKDAALEDTLEQARALLHTHGFPIELVSSKNPVPHCWSVHLRSTECPQIYTNGKGNSRLASEASALLEFFERLSTNLFFFDSYLGDTDPQEDFLFYPTEKWFPITDPSRIPTHHPDGTELLNSSLRDLYNPEGELTPAHLLDNNIDRPDRGIAALPFENLETSDTVYVPVSLLTNLYVSNGMAAGNTPNECRAQALAEIIERSVKNRIIAQGLCLPTVPEEVLARTPRIQEDIQKLQDHGFTILVKDASLGGEFPVICVLLIHPENGGCYAAFGASCRFEVALERTVTELLQGRSLDQLDVFQRPSHDLEAVADPLNLESHFIDSNGLLSWKLFGDTPDFVFVDWDFQGTTAEEFDHLKSIIRQQGFPIYCAEYSHCGIFTCRILVPGLSEIYPIDDLIWSNKNAGASLRPTLLKLNTLSTDELADFASHLDSLGLNDQQPVSDAIGILFPEESGWYTLRIGELKAMLALATGNLDAAAPWCEGCQHIPALPAERQQLYRAIHELLQFERAGDPPADYETPLGRLYGESILTDAKELVSGKQTFHGLTFASRWEDLAPTHQMVLRLHDRLHPLKAAAP